MTYILIRHDIKGLHTNQTDENICHCLDNFNVINYSSTVMIDNNNTELIILRNTTYTDCKKSK
jgi:hypothetical protein